MSDAKQLSEDARRLYTLVAKRHLAGRCSIKDTDVAAVLGVELTDVFAAWDELRRHTRAVGHVWYGMGWAYYLGMWDRPFEERNQIGHQEATP